MSLKSPCADTPVRRSPARGRQTRRCADTPVEVRGRETRRYADPPLTPPQPNPIYADTPIHKGNADTPLSRSGVYRCIGAGLRCYRGPQRASAREPCRCTPIHNGTMPKRRCAARAVRGVTVYRCIGARLFWGRCLRALCTILGGIP